MSAKQDRTYTRTASDLERKLNLKERFSEVMGVAEDARSAADEAANAKVGNNILIGTAGFTGRNWINMNYWFDDGTFNGFTVKTRVGSYGGLKQDINVVAGEVYTISAYVKSTGIFHFHPFIGMASGFPATGYQTYGAMPEWTRLSNTFTATETGILAPGYEIKGNDGQLWICGMKLEKGNKATEWCPHLTETTVSPESVFNALTNNGQNQGLFRGENGELYINASYIVSGILKSLNKQALFNLETGQLFSVDSDGTAYTELDSGEFHIGNNKGTSFSVFDDGFGASVEFTHPSTGDLIGYFLGIGNEFQVGCYDQETGTVEAHTVSWKKINGVYTLVGE